MALEQRNGLVVVPNTTPRPVRNSKSRFGTTRKHSWILPDLRFQVIYQTDFINCKDPWLRLKLTIFNASSFVVGTGGCHNNLRCGQCRQRCSIVTNLGLHCSTMNSPSVNAVSQSIISEKRPHFTQGRDVQRFCVALCSSEETQVKMNNSLSWDYFEEKSIYICIINYFLNIGVIDNIWYDISCWTSACWLIIPIWFSNILSDDDLSTVHAFDQVSPPYVIVLQPIGLWPSRNQSIGPLGTNFSEIWKKRCHSFNKKIILKMSSAKYQPFFRPQYVNLSSGVVWQEVFLVTFASPSNTLEWIHFLNKRYIGALLLT